MRSKSHFGLTASRGWFGVTPSPSSLFSSLSPRALFSSCPKNSKAERDLVFLPNHWLLSLQRSPEKRESPPLDNSSNPRDPPLFCSDLSTDLSPLTRLMPFLVVSRPNLSFVMRTQLKKEILDKLGLSAFPDKPTRPKDISAFFSKRCLPPSEEPISILESPLKLCAKLEPMQEDGGQCDTNAA
ncbi:hypothetical protein J5N97_014004 [Dioscorea zingiberensis]|uniref:Uncharacterized protein n=1 Tax=Dioscorea zingiberensis TaxID=325984 RepID=A0A9D5CRL0_9LILI|nr:hypothetical protein J5N97_014004 [Dioscorea zingiberensis]